MTPVLTDDPRWESEGVTISFLVDRARWLSAPRSLNGNSLRFFEIAGSLIHFARYDYKLASVAFFQAVLGLEKALKLHYRSPGGKLKSLLIKATTDGLIREDMFVGAPAFTKPFAQAVERRIGKKRMSYLEKLVALLPELRNEYVHGDYILAPDLLHLTFQVRTIADALTTKRVRTK